MLLSREHIVNDILVALWLTAESILFSSESTTTPGTWFFLVGSVELLVRAGDSVGIGRRPGPCRCRDQVRRQSNRRPRWPGCERR